MTIGTKQRALDLFEERRGVYLSTARLAAIYLGRKYGYVTIESVRKVCPVPEGISTNVLGAVFRGQKHFKFDGYIQSKRPSSHGRRIARYQYLPYHSNRG